MAGGGANAPTNVLTGTREPVYDLAGTPLPNLATCCSEPTDEASAAPSLADGTDAMTDATLASSDRDTAADGDGLAGATRNDATLRGFGA